MLENIFIKNVALIKNENVNLTKGLNIISGETGSGKSMFIEAINFMLGGKIPKNFIRHGAETAEVTGTFFIENKFVFEKLLAFDVEIEEDNLVQLKRIVHDNGKTLIKVNGKTTPIGIIKSIASLLVDVHLQHQHQSLLSQSKHIEFLDILCGNKIDKLKSDLNIKYKDFKLIEKEIQSIEENKKENNIKIDMLKFQFEELSDADLTEDEEDILLKRRKILSFAEKIKENADKFLYVMYDDDDSASAYDKITQAINSMEIISNADESMTTHLDILMDMQANIEDMTRSIRSYNSELQVEPFELNEIEERLNLISTLKKKYGNTISEILSRFEKIQEELDKLENSDDYLEKLSLKKNAVLKECKIICLEITKVRKSFIPYIEKNMKETLIDLGMKDIEFKILIEEKEIFNSDGADNVSFLISTNKGQELKPLDKIASGGEMSRIMIAIKNLISKSYEIETFIFDEIDTGVSGRTAQKVGEKLSHIGTHHQIICITHLPQIAAMGDNHLMIFKETVSNETVTHIKNLTYNDEVGEIARLIGGAKITDATMDAAKEMKNMAIDIKEKLV